MIAYQNTIYMINDIGNAWKQSLDTIPNLYDKNKHEKYSITPTPSRKSNY